MAAGLGLDGGGSATRWALAAADGTIMARGDLPPVSGHLLNADASAHLAGLVRTLCAALPAPAAVGAVMAGLTGLSSAAPEAAVASRILAEALDLDPERIAVTDDLTIAYHAVFAPGEGHVVYAGTGSVGMYLRDDGTAVHVGGRGMLIDDAGSAFWIGGRALNLIYRRIDDDPDAVGALAREIWAEVGGDTWADVRSFAYADGRHRVSRIARAVGRAAAAGDADALAILGEAGEELARLARALVRREGIRPVALIGGALRLHPVIVERARAALTDLDVRQADPDAAAAAARLAARVATGQA